MVMLIGLYEEGEGLDGGAIYSDLSLIIPWNLPGSWSIDWANREPYRCDGSRLAFPEVSSSLGIRSSGVSFIMLSINSAGSQS